MKVLVLSIIPIVAFAIGALIARRKPPLSAEERKELNRLRQMREDLMGMASEHIALGDTFATIAYDRMRQERSNQ